MIPGHRLAIPCTVWAAGAAVLLAITDTPMLDAYRAALPFGVEPILPVHGAIVSLAVLAPYAIKPNELWSLTFRTIAITKAVFAVLILAVGGWLEPYGVAAALAAALVAAAVPVRTDGWISGSMRRQAGASLVYLAVFGCALYASYAFPDAALVAVVAMSALIAAVGVVRRREMVVAELPPGYDWRNTPDLDHPGGFMCPCPRHTRVRRSPGVIFLCPDCMKLLTEPPNVTSRATRVHLWVLRNVVIGKFAYLREARDPDDCYFCSSASGGLGGRVVPPPDAA